MAASSYFFRFFRFLRSFAVPITTGFALCFLLSIFLVLYQPLQGPDHIQKVGWQSWSVVSVQDLQQIPSSSHGGSYSSGVDWWNVTADATPALDTASFPLDEWNPLLPHETGLSEVAVQNCLMSPNLVFGNLCDPPTTIEEDAVKGKWVRVNSDLNVRSGLYWLYVYYRRTRRLDIPLITELQILPEGKQPSDMSSAWRQATRSLRDGVRGTSPVFLWYKAEKTRREMSDQEAQKIITEVDVLNGEDQPWYGFEMLEPPTTVSKPGRYESVHLLYRRGIKPVPKAPPLHFSREGRFKILQVADLHFSIFKTKCRDSSLSPCTHSDNLTATLLGRVLDTEKPDLVVFTGDQLNGQDSTWDARSVLAKFARAVTDRRIPWAAVFGNHDDEDGINRVAQLRMLQGLPYSLVQRGPTDIHGVGNYVLKVRSADPSMTHLLTLYFLDSGAYDESGGLSSWFNFGPKTYDWIHQDQTDWFLQESARINPIERPFHPDSAKDLGGIWRERDQVTPPAGRLAKPNALMFFHIPLQESYSGADMDPIARKALDVGSRLDGNGASKKNDGFFQKGLLRALESEHRAGGGAPEVKVIGNGHCHVSDNCRRIKGVWMCFGGGGSYSGYGKVGFDRRFRIYDISDYGETITSWKRTEHDDIIDKMILAGHGAAAATYMGSS